MPGKGLPRVRPGLENRGRGEKEGKGRSVGFYGEAAGLYGEIFPPREEVIRFLLERLGPGKGPWLDVGCGPGLQAGALASRGIEVTGVDADRAMIEEARRRFPRVTFLCLDMRRIGEAGSGFRGGYCLGNVLPHLSPGEIPPFLEALGKVMEPGARWAVQTVNWDGLAGKELFRFPEKKLSGGGILRREYRLLGDGRCRFLLEVERDGAVLLRGEETLHPLGAALMDRLHEEAGFRKIGRWGDFRGGAFRKEAVPGGNVTVYRFFPDRRREVRAP